MLPSNDPPPLSWDVITNRLEPAAGLWSLELKKLPVRAFLASELPLRLGAGLKPSSESNESKDAPPEVLRTMGFMISSPAFLSSRLYSSKLPDSFSFSADSGSFFFLGGEAGAEVGLPPPGVEGEFSPDMITNYYTYPARGSHRQCH